MFMIRGLKTLNLFIGNREHLHDQRLNPVNYIRRLAEESFLNRRRFAAKAQNVVKTTNARNVLYHSPILASHFTAYR